MLLRPQHYKAIQLLVTTDLKSKEIAHEVGVSAYTLRKWRKDPDFSATLSHWQRLDPESVATFGLYAARSMVLKLFDKLGDEVYDVPVQQVVSLLGKLVPRTMPTPEGEHNDAEEGNETLAESNEAQPEEHKAQPEEQKAQPEEQKEQQNATPATQETAPIAQ